MADKKNTIKNILFIIFMVIMIILILFTIKIRLTGGEPSLLGYRLYVLDNGSMSPTLRIGTLIIVKEIEPKEVESEDIITYHGSEDSIVTHRVMEIKDEGATFITKGDANDSEDPMPLNSNRLIGKVILSIPCIGFLLKLLQTGAGIIGIAILILIVIIARNILTKQEEDEACDKGGEV